MLSENTLKKKKYYSYRELCSWHRGKEVLTPAVFIRYPRGSSKPIRLLLHNHETSETDSTDSNSQNFGVTTNTREKCPAFVKTIHISIEIENNTDKRFILRFLFPF